MVALKGDKEIGDKINKIIAKLAEANDLQNVIDLADFNDEEKLGKGKEMQDRLSKLVAIFDDLDFRGSRAEGDDLLGDAYEYLMRHFATESGKSKGQFYTPAEVSRILAKVVGIGADTRQDQTVYDPTCGSGSLLLKAADEAPRGMTIYGQEKDNATWALSQDEHDPARQRDRRDRARATRSPARSSPSGAQLKTFDFVVANPPFSTKSWSNGLENDYGRFEFGRPPEKNGDYAFLLHVAQVAQEHRQGGGHPAARRAVPRQRRGDDPHASCSSAATSRASSACRRTSSTAPASRPASSCSTRRTPQARTGIFMIDASKGFMKDGTKNRLRSQDIHKIVDVFNKQIEIDRYSRMVPLSEIADPKNDYNLNIPRYIDSSEPEDIQDLHAHLHGGIPDRDLDALSDYWDAFPSCARQLFKPNRPGYSDLAVDVDRGPADHPRLGRVPGVRRRGARHRRRLVRRAPPAARSDRRRHQAQRADRRASATTCSPASGRCRCSTSTTSTSSS